jgi:hypothetical protein
MFSVPVEAGKGVGGGDEAEYEEDALGEEDEEEEEEELEEARDGLVEGNGAGSIRIPCIVGRSGSSRAWAGLKRQQENNHSTRPRMRHHVRVSRNKLISKVPALTTPTVAKVLPSS